MILLPYLLLFVLAGLAYRRVRAEAHLRRQLEAALETSEARLTAVEERLLAQDEEVLVLVQVLLAHGVTDEDELGEIRQRVAEVVAARTGADPDEVAGAPEPARLRRGDRTVH